MSLFQSLSSNPGVFIRNITFAEDKTKCSQHQEELDTLYCREGLFGKREAFAACSQCTKPSEANQKCLVKFQADSLNQRCVISPILSEKSSEAGLSIMDPPLDFGNKVLEHIFYDTQSTGYGLRSLVYMKDQQVLATCSKNGSICFWSIGEKIELKGPKISLEKTINFAKYCDISEEKKWFAVGTDKGVHVYNMAAKEGEVQLLGVIDEENQVSDVDFLKEENKMITVNNESLAKVWSLDTLTNEETIDLQKYDIKGNVHTLIYMEQTNEMAIEHERGLSLIDWQYRGDNCVKLKVRHHIVPDKKDYGCIHLPKSKRFILHNNNTNVQVLNEEDLTELNSHKRFDSLFKNHHQDCPMSFSSSDDESRIISNDRFCSILDFEQEKAHLDRYYLSSFIFGIAGVELIEDQYRFIIAHKNQGIVEIHRINANMRIQTTKRGSHEHFLPAVENNWSIVHSTDSRGGLFGNSGSRLFSSRPSSGGLFSSSRNMNNNRASIFGARHGQCKKAPVTSKRKQATKSSKKGKKIKKVEITSKTKKKVSEKKEPKRKSKISKSLKKKIQDKEDNLTEIVRIRTKKGGRSKAKEEKVWIVLSSEDEVKRGRSKEKKDLKDKNKKEKRKVSKSEERSRSRSNSKSLTRKSK